MKAFVKLMLFVLVCLGGAWGGRLLAGQRWCVSSPSECIEKTCKSFSNEPGQEPKALDGYYLDGGQRIPVKCYLTVMYTAKICDVSNSDSSMCCGKRNDIKECNGWTSLDQADHTRHGCWLDVAQCDATE